MIRGAVYRINLGDARRGHEQRGRRYGLSISEPLPDWSVTTIIPTSTGAGASIYRPEIEMGGQTTRLLVDQIRTIDISFVEGDPVHFLDWHELAVVETTLKRYLGLR